MWQCLNQSICLFTWKQWQCAQAALSQANGVMVVQAIVPQQYMEYLKYLEYLEYLAGNSDIVPEQFEGNVIVVKLIFLWNCLEI